MCTCVLFFLLLVVLTVNMHVRYACDAFYISSFLLSSRPQTSLLEMHLIHHARLVFRFMRMNIGGDAASGANNIIIKMDLIGTSAAKQYSREKNLEQEDTRVYGEGGKL